MLLPLTIFTSQFLMCTMARMPKRKRPSGELGLVQCLLPSVWGLAPETAPSYRLAAYGEHWRETVTSIDDVDLLLTPQRNVTKLIAIVRGSSQGSVGDVEAAIAKANLDALPNGADAVSVTAALRFAMRLWLFTEPDLSDKSLTLSQLVEKQLPQATTPTTLANYHHLSDDFSVKSLTRKAGFRLVWTSYLSQHLTFEGTSHLRVFRHASALRQYANLKSTER
jgi:hypothetical protein